MTQEAVVQQDIQGDLSKDIKVGDVVKLKSGGSAMTVIAPPKKDVVLCRWWSVIKEGYSQDRFPIQAIRRVDMQKQ